MEGIELAEANVGKLFVYKDMPGASRWGALFYVAGASNPSYEEISYNRSDREFMYEAPTPAPPDNNVIFDESTAAGTWTAVNSGEHGQLIGGGDGGGGDGWVNSIISKDIEGNRILQRPTNPGDIMGVEFKFEQITNYMMLGLDQANDSASYTDIDFTAYVVPGGGFEIYEVGSRVPAADINGVQTYTAYAVIRIIINDNNQIEYYVNDELKYTSTRPINYPLHVDASFYTSNSAARDIHWVRKQPPPPIAMFNEHDTPCIHDVSNIAKCREALVSLGWQDGSLQEGTWSHVSGCVVEQDAPEGWKHDSAYFNPDGDITANSSGYKKVCLTEPPPAPTLSPSDCAMHGYKLNTANTECIQCNDGEASPNLYECISCPLNQVPIYSDVTGGGTHTYNQNEIRSQSNNRSDTSSACRPCGFNVVDYIPNSSKTDCVQPVISFAHDIHDRHDDSGSPYNSGLWYTWDRIPMWMRYDQLSGKDAGVYNISDQLVYKGAGVKIIQHGTNGTKIRWPVGSGLSSKETLGPNDYYVKWNN
jgi:hypothetical protein